MAIVISGSGTITGISEGGLPDGSVAAADIKDGAVTTAKIADGEVTMAKLASSGTLPALDGSSLTGISSGWTPISTVSTGTASYVEFALSSSYEQFVILLNEVQVSTSTFLYGLVSTDSGSTYESTDYWHWADGGSQSYLKFIITAMGDQATYADGGLSGEISVYGTQSSSTVSRFDTSLCFFRENSPTPYKADLSTVWGGTTVVNKLKLYPAAGNFTSGKMTLYGLAGA